jgi:hypothetical protein
VQQKQGIEGYDEQEEDSSNSENEGDSLDTFASYDEVCIPNSKADAVCFKTTITQSLSASGIKMILMNQMMKMNMMITKKMTRWTASSTHLCSQALIKM